MNWIRPIKMEDFSQFLKLVEKAQVGLSSLPLDKTYLKQRIEDSLMVFEDPNYDGGYLFVLEDTDLGVVGCCGISPRTGGEHPFYTFELNHEIHPSTQLTRREPHPFVKLLKVFQGPTEIGSLFLDPDYRKKGIGKLLSFSRFLFMASFPSCFRTEVIAEIRGVISQDGRSPFFEAIGRHFFDMEFPYVDYITSLNKDLLKDLLPRQSIYINLIPQDAKDCVGQVHTLTKAAFKMLETQGFKPKNWIDVFDAGPVMSANLFEIQVIKASKILEVESKIKVSNRPCFISNISKDFRAIFAEVPYDENKIELTSLLQKILKVSIGDKVRIWKGY